MLTSASSTASDSTVTYDPLLSLRILLLTGLQLPLHLVHLLFKDRRVLGRLDQVDKLRS